MFDPDYRGAHIPTMLTLNEVKELGLAAAREAAGENAVHGVAVAPDGDDDDLPTYRFAFLIDQGAAKQRAGMVRIELMRFLSEALEARGDDHRPELQILNHADWDRRWVA